MRRGNKPQQQIYRPGSGPLRKSNTGIEESESDTNIVINSRQNQSKHLLVNDDMRHKSEGSSPRDKVADIDTTARVGDISVSPDASKRQKKPEQMHYVPRPLVHARELSASQDFTRSNPPTNGNEKSYESDRYGNSKSKRYFERKRADDNDFQNEWRETSPSVYRPRQGSEPRAINNGPGSGSNWYRTRDRDTRSVEPGASNRNYTGEKIQSKPPSGRRHSTIGLEPEKRHKLNIDNLPPRLRKKFLGETATTPEENWDGSSLTFQGHSSHSSNVNNPSFHQMGATYNTLPANQHLHNQIMSNSGYHTLPNRPRGRGRLQHEYENPPGQMYRSMTPDRIRSPCNSRPPTPPLSGNRRPDSRPHTPVSDYQENRSYQDRYNKNVQEDRSKNLSDQLNIKRQNESRAGPKGREYDSRRHVDFNRDGGNYRGDNRRGEDNYNKGRGRMQDNYKRDKETPNRETPNRDNRRHRDTPNRENRRDGGVSNKDRRRDNRRDRRSRSRDYNSTPSNVTTTTSTEENWFPDEENNDRNGVTHAKGRLHPSLEAQLSPVSPDTPEEASAPISLQIISTMLDWSEEVELNDKLEAEALSDALTRSSSITSLHEVSTKSLQLPINSTPPTSKKSKKKSRRRSKHRSGERSSSRTRNRGRQNSTTSVDNFKVPQDGYPRRRSSKDRRERSYERFHGGSRNPSREGSWDRTRGSSNGPENWREEMVRSRQNSERSDCILEDGESGTKKPGIIVLPNQKSEQAHPPSLSNSDHPRYLDTRKSPCQQKSLFDPNNPSKPIIVKPTGSRVAVPGFSDNAEETPPEIQTTDQYSNVRPTWYDENMESFTSSYFPELLRDVKKADTELQYIINSGLLLVKWDVVDNLRQFLKEALQYLLGKAIKFCQMENIEQHFWKILYHNIIEVTRNAINNDVANKENYKAFLLYLIDEGTKYFESLLVLLESAYGFKVGDYLGPNSLVSHKGLGLTGMALVSAQKIFLFLGDLGRYREQVNETSNYGKCRQWYIKSHEINPKNGKPYNQLAILAVYARRKLDAVYYYMRSLMSSNPVPTARQNLISLFDENRKKYEQGEKKRREERLERQRQQMKQKESEDSGNIPGSLRKETWIHPEGGRRVHRTTQAMQEQKDSEEEDLASLSSVEVNKRFVISYLHVHGKLITKIGMESFQETAMQMLREFRALLQHSPVPLPCNRFLQLLALNMFAIESTQLKDPQLQMQPGYRSELQERALVVSLQMFNLILERCVSILQDHVSSNKDISINSLPQDANVLLPAIKVWCDWMLGHTKVWNPPPSTQDFRVGSPGDAWSRLATLMNLLEQMDQSATSSFAKSQQEGYESIRLPEDGVLSGFTPLMYTVQDLTYAPKELDTELAYFALRLSKLLFFGTVYLCGVDPPVLKLEIEDDTREYVSVVSTSRSRDSPPSPHELTNNNDILLEDFSGEEDEAEEENVTQDAPTEIRSLLTRKVELEKRKRSQELHMQRVKKILSQSVVSVHMEVRPKYLVPDTNCFIDHLDGIRTIAQSHCYTLMVPIVVLSELEGLSRGGKAPTPDSRSFLDPQHVKKVAESAKNALDFLRNRHASVKCVTTKGAIIASTTFSTEDDATWDSSLRNDDKILTTCLVLCKSHKDKDQAQVPEGEPRHLVREVVLITEDRNLRVKAHARDVPVRELPDFMRWAGLG
ncbi:telomerase-binding protein EST1A isoform X2 [Anoplophora glabripennis]|nr:telomerase-binding protein EST1A isoform X2 [Anoplophora glabripennis]